MMASGTLAFESASSGGLDARFRALVSGRRRGPWPSCQRLGLWAASLAYARAVALRNRLYDRGWKRSFRPPVPVVSVGNLSLGGTGKTPCVEYVARACQGLGRRVAILSRGYAAQGGDNDEARVLRQNLPDVPHLQGPDRGALARIAVEKLDSDVLVLDDGFQHRRLARDLDIVLLDATEPWGYGHLFPRGMLREAPEALARAGFIVLTRSDQVAPEVRGRLRDAVARLAPAVPLAEARHRPVDLVNGDQDTAPLAWLAGRPVAAFCGIGNPEAFRRTLADAGACLTGFRAFPDHHAYTPADRGELEGWARRLPADAILVTTQKDRVKFRAGRLGDRELWAVRIRLEVGAGREALDRELRNVLSVRG